MAQHWLAQLRKRSGITQKGLSEALKAKGYSISDSAVSHWENSRDSMPLDIPRFRSILASVLNISETELLAEAGYLPENELSLYAERAAALMERIPEDKRDLALGILEKFVEAN